jgi:hypothetical protein
MDEIKQRKEELRRAEESATGKTLKPAKRRNKEQS